MQINSLYLYPNKVDVYTSDTAAWTKEGFNMVYNRNLKVYRGADNRIDVQLKNRDQKAYNASGTHIVFNLVSTENNDLVLRKDCDIDDLTVGRVYVTITDTELLDIEPGQYTYSFHKETRTNIDSTQYEVDTKTPMYLDSQYGAIGTVEVIGGMEGKPYDTIEIYNFNKEIDFSDAVYTPSQTPQFNNPRPNYNQNNISGQTYQEYHYSSLVDGQPNLTTPNSLHTFQVYYKSYTGEVKIQGSLADGATPTLNSWFDIDTYNITPSNANEFYNVTGKYNWLRIKHTPDENNTGSLDRILYR